MVRRPQWQGDAPLEATGVDLVTYESEVVVAATYLKTNGMEKLLVGKNKPVSALNIRPIMASMQFSRPVGMHPITVQSGRGVCLQSSARTI